MESMKPQIDMYWLEWETPASNSGHQEPYSF